MKKILLIFVILGALASVAGCILGLSASEVLASPNRINGSGNLIDRTIPAPDFETVSSACGVTVLITDDNTDRIRIEADDNLMEYVVVEERQGTLRVALDQGRKGARSVSNAHVTVTVPSNGKIRALKASSASQIVCRTALGADDFSIETSSAAKVEAAVKAGKCSLDASSASKIVAALDVEECRADASSASKIVAALDVEECRADASSAAKITLSGKAAQFRANLSSAAKLSADELDAATCSIDTSSGSKASVHCSGTLRANASSGSSIRYSGDCSTHLSKSSGGSIRN